MVIKAQHSGLMTWWNLTHLQCPAVLQVYDKQGWSKLQHCSTVLQPAAGHTGLEANYNMMNQDQMKHMATVTIIIQIIIELTTYKSK